MSACGSHECAIAVTLGSGTDLYFLRMHIETPSAVQGDKLLLGACQHPGELEVLKVLLKADVATSARANKVSVCVAVDNETLPCMPFLTTSCQFVVCCARHVQRHLMDNNDGLQGVCPLVTACTHANWPAAELLVKRRKDKVDNVDEEVVHLTCLA